MKRLIILLLAVLLMLCSCSAEATFINNLSSDAPLISMGDTVLMTVKDYNALVTEDMLDAQYLGEERSTTEELFTSACEYEVLYYFSVIYGEDASLEEAYASYEDYMNELNTTADTELLTYFTRLKEELGMNDEEFKEWYCRKSILQTSAENLTDGIAETYQNITDSELMHELILENVYQLMDIYEYNCSFEGFEDYTPTFEDII